MRSLTVFFGGLLALSAAHPVNLNQPKGAEIRSIAKYGIYGKDFAYYQPESSKVDPVVDGVKISRWEGGSSKAVDLVEAQPYITKIEIPQGHPLAFPNASSYWLRDDVSYVVISGNATFGNTSNPVHGYGDVYWVMAGQAHGPVFNVGSSPLVFLAVGMDFDPQYSSQPSWYNPSVNWYLTYERSYRRVDGLADEGWNANPSPHSDECLANGGVYNMNFAADSNTMPVLRVKWAANCSIPFHYHPTGAMYFVLYGQMYYAGDFETDKAFNAGDSRWVRPGFAYGPEYNADAPMEITVFGTDTPPTFGTPPEGPYKVQKSVQVTHVFDHQPGIINHTSTKEL